MYTTKRTLEDCFSWPMSNLFNHVFSQVLFTTHLVYNWTHFPRALRHSTCHTLVNCSNFVARKKETINLFWSFLMFTGLPRHNKRWPFKNAERLAAWMPRVNAKCWSQQSQYNSPDNIWRQFCWRLISSFLSLIYGEDLSKASSLTIFRFVTCSVLGLVRAFHEHEETRGSISCTTGLVCHCVEKINHPIPRHRITEEERRKKEPKPRRPQGKSC